MHKSSERSDEGCVWNEDAPTVVSCAFFSAIGACGHLQPQALLCLSVPLGRKGHCNEEQRFKETQEWVQSQPYLLSHGGRQVLLLRTLGR